MTEKANPSINRPAEAFKTAGAIAYGGHGEDGFVVDGANPTEISVQDGGITEADLNAFAETSSGSSFDVTIDGGEAFVFGSWLAIDTDTTVTLASSTTGQTVYVGWNKNGADDVIVGLDSAFSDASGDTDERIPLWTFDTDGSGVTSVTDERQIGKLNTGGVDLQGGSFRDSTQGYLDLTGDGEDLRLATGQAIEDGDGTSRITFKSNRTEYQYLTANVPALAINEGNFYKIRALSDTPFVITDQEGNFDAVQYDTDASAGTFRGVNAAFRVEAEIPSFSEGLNLDYVSTSEARIQAKWGGANRSSVNLKDGLIDMSTDASNLRLATGQSIENGGGDAIVDITSAHPQLYFRANDGNVNTLIRDTTGGFAAVRYINSSSAPGTLELTSADLDASPSNKMTLPYRSSDPTAGAGDMWYRTDLD